MRSTAFLALLVLGTAGCSLFQSPETIAPDVSTVTFAEEVTPGTPELWGEVWSQAKVDGRHRVGLLNRGDEALDLRINLIRSARTSIKIQTFIWADDECGRLIVWELLKAARQRQVHVQLLVDQMFSANDPASIAALAVADPNLELRFYNPPTESLKTSMVGALRAAVTDFERINTRMHNKVLVVDDRVAITGGRNIANEYYDRNIGLNFKDRDVVLVGDQVEEMTRSFVEYWEHPVVVPAHNLEDVSRVIEEDSYPRRIARRDYHFNSLFPNLDVADDPHEIRRRFVDVLLDVGEVRFVADSPNKDADRVTPALMAAMQAAEESVLLQSPYLVLSDRAINAFRELREQENAPVIRVSTNSLAATDSWPTYAVSYKQKRIYLEELGFVLREFRPIPADIHTMMAYAPLLDRRPTPAEVERDARPEFRIDGSLAPFPRVTEDGNEESSTDRRNPHLQSVPYLCLHQKSAVVDGSVSFVGSMNLDPRSLSINTEEGLFITDTRFAAALTADIERDMEPRNSYVIARRQSPRVLGWLSSLAQRTSEDSPVDLWPFRNVSSFTLPDGAKPVPVGDPTFHKEWEDVGNFPLLPLGSSKRIFARLTKAIGKPLYPLF